MRGWFCVAIWPEIWYYKNNSETHSAILAKARRQEPLQHIGITMISLTKTKSLIFPRFCGSIPCNCTPEAAFFRMVGAAKERDSCFKVVRADPKNHTIQIIETTGSILFYNSFLPEIEIRVTSERSGTCMKLLFSLRKSVEIALSVILGFAMLLALLFFIGAENRRDIVFAPMLLLAVAFVAHIFLFIVFRFFAKRAMKKLVQYTGLPVSKEDTL